jgi:tRNA pseudouridine38-40 synthase
MNNYKLLVRYCGAGFLGWQVQSGAGKTIQGELNSALKKICKSEEITTIGSGRTDASVHALGQVVRAHIPLDIESVALKKGLNSLLSDSIEVLHVEECSLDFHPIFSAKSKVYKYIFCLSSNKDPFLKNLITFFPRELDIETMNEGAKLFEGSHNFQNYFCVGTPVKSYDREIYHCEISPLKNHKSSFWNVSRVNCFVLEIHGNGFLKQMVRLIMGHLFKVGEGKMALEEIEYSLENSLEKHLAPVAPPEGLYLSEVFY